MYDVTITSVAPSKVIGIQHSGNYLDIGQSFERLFTWLGVRNLMQPDTRVLGIYYCDINVVPEADLRSHACAVIDQDIDVDAPVEQLDNAGGDYAVLTHKGPYSDLKVAYDWLYGQWLVESGRAAANEPVFEEYMNSPLETAPTELLTKVCLPLA